VVSLQFRPNICTWQKHNNKSNNFLYLLYDPWTGEHGGDAPSIKFFDNIGLDYVSCSPFRVPVARLASGQSSVTRQKGAAKPITKKERVMAMSPLNQ
jgi:hypothetical protein